MEQIIAQLKDDPEANCGDGADVAAISEIESKHGIVFPGSYRSFLMAINGGEFRFGRLYRVSSDGGEFIDFEEEFERIHKHCDLVSSGRLLPFGDDYSGNLFCFEGTAGVIESPVCLLDRLLLGERIEILAGSFAEFVQSGMN